MPANYESVFSISRTAGADYSQPNVGQNRFAKINANAVVNYTNPDNPGLWYGSDGPPPPIPAGNVLVNTTAGAACPFVLVGKALPGQPIECAYAGRILVLAGAGIAVGAQVMSDNTGAAVTATGGNVILGTALSAAVAGQLVDILFDPRGTA